MKKLFVLAAFFTASLSFAYETACWQGFYLLGQLGGGFGKEECRFKNNNYFNTLGSELIGSRFTLKPNGFLGGGGIGYNWQRGCTVFGIEGAALGGSVKDRRKSPFFPDLDTFSTRVNWLALAKVRLGRAYGNYLPFLSAGWSGGAIHLHLHDSLADIKASSSNFANGWTIGAGCDYKFSECLSFGVGYDYLSLSYSNKRIGCPSCGTGIGLGTPNVSCSATCHLALFRILFSL